MAGEVNVFDLPSVDEEERRRRANVFDLPPAPVRDDRAQRLGALFADEGQGDRATVLQISKEAQIPTALVEANLPLWKKRFEAAKRDPQLFLEENPGIAELVLDNPQISSVALGDDSLARFEKNLSGRGAPGKKVEDPSAALTGWDRYFGKTVGQRPATTEEQIQSAEAGAGLPETVPVTQPGIFGAAYRQAEKGVELSKLGRQIMDRVALGEDTYDLEKQVVDLRRELVPRDYRQGRWEQAVIDAMDILPSQFESMKGTGQGAAAGAAAGAVVGGAAGSLLGGAGAIPGAKVGAGIGARLGGKVGTFWSTFQLERGGAYLDIRDMRTDDGLPVDEDVARGAAIAYGLASAAVETASMGPVLKMLGPVGDAFVKGQGKAFMAAMLKEKGFRAILKDVAKRWVKGAAAEATEEAVQDVLQDLAGYWAKARTAGEADGQVLAPQEAQVAESLSSAMETWTKTFRGTLVVGAAGGVSTMVQHQVGQEMAHQDFRRVESLIDVASSSETAKTLPGEVARLAELVTGQDGEPVKAAYIDPKAFVELFQGENGDPRRAALELMGEQGPRRLDEALATGRKLEVPMAEYLQAWAPKPVAAALAKDTALRPDGVTLNEAGRQEKEIEAQATKLADSFMGEKPPAPVSEQEARLEALAKQLVATGVYTKADVRRAIHLPRAFVRTMAERMKVDADALFADITQRVEKAAGTETGGLEQAYTQAATKFWEGLKADGEKRMAARVAALGAEAAKSDPRYRAARDDVVRAEHALEAPPTFGAGFSADVTSRLGLQDPRSLSQGGRGRVQFLTEAGKRVYRILFTEKADKSTFLHETAHVFWDVFAQLAEREDAPASVRRDLELARRWMGAEPGQAPSVEALEKWARGFERYLGEGEAPSEELVGSFQRFRFWLLSIYRELSSLAVELDPEIRGVFDRLIATDAEIAKVRRAMGAEQAVFQSAEEAGLSIQEWQDYLDGRADSFEKAAVALSRRVAREKAREAEAWWKAQLAQAEEEAAAEYETLPAAKARRYVLRSELVQPDGTTVVDPKTGKLDRAAVEAAIGKEQAKRLGTRIVEGGQNPDEVAQLFGFSTGAEMLREVLALPEQGAWSEERAKMLMVERHGDLVAEVDRLREAAEKAAHSAPVGDSILREFGILWAKVGPQAGERPPAKAAIQRAARLIAERQTLGRIEPTRALTAERAAAELAVLRARQGRWAESLQAKSQQLLNHFLWKELQAAKESREALQDAGASLGRDKALARVGKTSPALRDGIIHVLEAVGLREPSLDPKRISWDAVLAHLGAIGHAVNFDTELVERLLERPQDWRELTVEEGRQVLGALQSLRQASVNLTKVLVDGKRVDREETVAQLIAEASEALPDRGPEASSEEAKGWVRRLLDVLQGWDGNLLKPETMLGWAGGARGTASIWFRAIVLPLQQAKQREAAILAEAVRPIIEAWDAMPREVRARLGDRIDGAALFPGHRENPAAPTKRFELLMMALNWGNDGNRQRLLDGRNLDQRQVEKALELLTKEEWDWVQAVWDAAESLWPLARALEERDAGMAPPKVDAVPVKTAFGSYRGGYFPAVYDRRVSRVGEKQTAETIGALLDPSYTTPGTPHSHLKKRATDFADVISLSPGVIQRHLAQVAHDVAYREVLKSVGSLILDDRVKETLRRRLGAQRAEQFLPWLKAIGSQRAVEGAEHAGAINRFLEKLRSNVPIATLGYAADVALGDLTNVLVAGTVKELSLRHYGQALLEFSNPLNTKRLIEEARGLSGELRFRDDQLLRDFATIRRDVTRSQTLATRALDAYRSNAFVLMEATDKLTTTPVWLGAYRQALASGKSQADAVTFADALVRKVFPSHSMVDKSGALRDRRLLGNLLLFHGYFNLMYSHERDLVHELYSAFHAGDRVEAAKELATKSPAVAMRLLALWMSFGVASELLSGRGPEEGDADEEEPDSAALKWRNWALRKLLVAPFTTLPFVGPVVEAKLLKKKVSERGAPGLALVQNLARAFEAAAADEEDWTKAFEEALRASGIAFGIPTARPVRVEKFVREWWMDEGAQPRGAGDVVGGLLYGSRDDQPENIPGLIQDRISGER